MLATQNAQQSNIKDIAKLLQTAVGSRWAVGWGWGGGGSVGCRESTRAPTTYREESYLMLRHFSLQFKN